MYLVINILLFEIIVMLSLIDHLTIKQIVLYAMPQISSYFLIPVLLLTFWYGGSKVKSIEYDDDSKVLSLWYYNWLFCPKQIHILLKNLSFQVYEMRAPFLFYRIPLIRIKDEDSKRTVIFTSGLGWRMKQVDEIVDKLIEIKKLDV